MFEPMLLTDDERNHGSSISSGGLQTPDELLHLPYLLQKMLALSSYPDVDMCLIARPIEIVGGF